MKRPGAGGLSVVEEIARDEKEDGRVEIVGEGFQRCQDRGVVKHHLATVPRALTIENAVSWWCVPVPIGQK